MKTRLLTLSLALILLLDGCSSGKRAYKQGDYYDAVLAAVQRLRGKPTHKKSIEVLKLSYQLAIDYLQTDTENQMTANANFKYRTAVQNYQKINNLYNEIRTSPGALKVIPKPVSKFEELTEYKAKAAEETYEAGILALLKNTREDAKQAYYLFNESNTYSPGYREAIEMIDQAKFNATLKVVVQPTLLSYRDWNFEPVLFGYTSNLFVQMYSPAQATEQNLQKIDQYIKVAINGYTEGRPAVTKKTETIKDSVKTGEKTVAGKKVPIYKDVSATLTTYTKTITGRGSLNLIITDGVSQAEIRNTEIVADESWSDTWATYAGDVRAMPDWAKKLSDKKEPFMNRGTLEEQTRRALSTRLANEIRNFYNQY